MVHILGSYSECYLFFNDYLPTGKLLEQRQHMVGVVAESEVGEVYAVNGAVVFGSVEV